MHIAITTLPGYTPQEKKTACTTAERSGCKPYGCNSLYRFRICKGLVNRELG